MIAASYILIDYIKEIAEPVVGDELQFRPGSFSPDSADSVFATYSVTQNLDYERTYVHLDTMQANIYHPNFDTVQTLAGVLLKRLNFDNQHNNAQLHAAGLVEGIRYDDVIAAVHNNKSGVYIEGTEYFTIRIDVYIQYVELFYPLTGSTRAHISA